MNLYLTLDLSVFPGIGLFALFLAFISRGGLNVDNCQRSNYAIH